MVKNGLVKVCGDTIVVKNPDQNGTYASITTCKGCNIYLNGVEQRDRFIVKEEDDIKIELEGKESVRKVDISVSKDNLKALVTINYEPSCKFSLKESSDVEDLEVILNQEELEMPEMITKDEIINELDSQGITYGIKYKVIEEISKSYNVKDIIVAEGQESIDAVDDTIEFLHNKVKAKTEKKIVHDAIDYKNQRKIDSVAVGDIVAGIDNGKDGVMGTNIYGDAIIPKREYHKNIICGIGCKREGDYVISTVDGQVFFKKNKVSVNKVYSVNSNVDISTGNINFHGDVIIKGNVTEGMTVCAQNNIKINAGAFSSSIISRGNTEIQGNVMNCRISAGGKDIQKELRVKNLMNLQKILAQLVDTLYFLKEKRILSDKQNIGVVIRSLIDTKFTEFNKTTIEAMSSILKENDHKSRALKFIKSKLIGIKILTVENIRELEDGLNVINEEIEILKEDGILEANIVLNYCQDTTMQTSGDIIINGKGVFTSVFYAGGQIIFTEESSVCRGGTLKAKKYIEAAIVGSEGGVKTVLEVEDKEGTISVRVAYNNTLIIIGNKQKFIDVPSKNIKCYIDKEGELIIEKFVL